MSESGKITPITVPQWGLSMTKGKIVGWLVGEGDDVDRGDETVEIETDKIVNVVEATGAGVLRRVVAEEGQELPVGALLGVLAEGDVGDDEIARFVDGYEMPELEEGPAAAAAAEPLSVDCGGLTVRYRVAPAAGEEDRAPAVLIHGFGGDGENWLFNASALAAERAVVMPDLPGHGLSSKALADGGLEALAAAVEAVIDDVGADAVHLVGHSLGAAVAVRVALDRPSQVKSLALIGGAGLTDQINGEFLNAFIAAGRRKDMKAVAQMLFADAALVTRDMVDNMLKFKRLDGVDAALAAIAGANFPGGAQTHDFRADIAALEIPVLALWGAADSVISPPGEGELPDNVSLVLINGAGHMPQMEAAGDVNRGLQAHFASAE